MMDTRKVLKVVSTLACLAGFLWQMSIVSDEYFSESTFVIIGQELFKELDMPLITVCVHEGMKRPGIFIHEEEYMENSFSREDIFAYTYDVNISDTPSMVYGMCYTMEYKKPVDLMNVMVVYLNTSMDYMVYIHEHGDEFWITIAFNPSDATKPIFVNANNIKLGGTSLRLTKVCSIGNPNMSD